MVSLNSFVLFITSIAVGMVFGLIIIPKYKLHGPNAKKFISKPYYSNYAGKCFKLNIKLVNCIQ